MSRHLILFSALLVAGCPGTNLPDSIDVLLAKTPDQTLIIENAGAGPLTLVSKTSHQEELLAAGQSTAIVFTVLSTGAYATHAETAYLLPSGVAATNSLIEAGNVGLVDTSDSAPAIHFIGADGVEHAALLDLNNCDPGNAGTRWERGYWPAATFKVVLPPPLPGKSTPICPGN